MYFGPNILDVRGTSFQRKRLIEFYESLCTRGKRFIKFLHSSSFGQLRVIFRISSFFSAQPLYRLESLQEFMHIITICSEKCCDKKWIVSRCKCSDIINFFFLWFNAQRMVCEQGNADRWNLHIQKKKKKKIENSRSTAQNKNYPKRARN